MVPKKARINVFDRWMMAVTFAEAGERTTALDLLSRKTRKRPRKRDRRGIQERANQRPVLTA